MEKRKFSRAKAIDSLFVYLCLLWPVIYFCIFTIGMNISMFVQSFQKASGTWTFNNYVSVFKTFTGVGAVTTWENPSAIWNSLSIVPLSLFINMPLSLLFSFAIYKKYFASGFYSVVLFIPTVISAVVLCLAFEMAVSRQYGFVTQFLMDIGANVPTNGYLGDKDTAWGIILVFSVWTGVNTNMIYFSSALGRVSESVIESAKIDGAGEIRQFLQMIIPMIWGTCTTISITAVSGMFSWYLPSLLLTNGSHDTSTIGLAIINRAQEQNPDRMGFVSALGVLVAVIGTAVTYGAKWLMERFWRDVEY